MTVTSGMILTVDTVPNYFKDHWKEIGLATVTAAEENESLFDKIKVNTIQGGNVNYAFCVQLPEGLSGKTVFLKQAPEFVAIFGPDGFPLTSQRMQLEMDVYDEWKTMLGESLATKYLPTIYHFDKKQMVVVMEFLDGCELLDHVLVSSTTYDESNESIVAKSLGQFMGTVHSMTHSSKVPEERKQYLTEHYTNRELRDVQLEFVFTKAYKEATDEQRCDGALQLSDDFMKEIEIIKKQYNGQDETCGYVLSHGDLHPGSVMVDVSSKEAKTKVIDPEFTVYGPAGLDVGSLLHGYCLGAIHQAYSNNPTAANKNIHCAETVWNSYKSALKENDISCTELLKQIEIETVGFTLAEVCRTALEFAGGRKWLQFDDPTTKFNSKKAALSLVNTCMIERHNGGIQLLFDQLKEHVSNIKLS